MSRQAKFRRQQEEYFPGIGLDYVNDDHGEEEEDGENFRTPSPLVLDPSQPTPLPSSSQKSGVVSRLVRGIGGGNSSTHRDPTHQNHHHQQQDYYSSPSRRIVCSATGSKKLSRQSQPQPQLTLPPPTASDFARKAPRAGFLQKLGSNVPEFKRRFFVLQPTTQLYYFLSPNDSIPRGSIAIDDAIVDIVEELQDGRCRIQLKWPDGQRIMLEARNRDMANEWCNSLQQERLSYVKGKLQQSQEQYAQAQYEIEELKQQLEDYRYVEQDRDGAIEDARRWKEQFEQLDEAIRLLANHVRKMPPATNTDVHAAGEDREMEEVGDTQTERNHGNKGGSTEEEAAVKSGEAEACVGAPKSSSSEGGKSAAEDKGPTDGNEVVSAEVSDKTKTKSEQLCCQEEEKKEDESELTHEDDAHQSDNDDDREDNGTPNANSRRDTSLLDDDAAAEEAAANLFESKNIMEELDAPGQHFGSLLNACQQLRENLRLASEEASAAVEDTKAAQGMAKQLQTRMTKAEKQLCQLWEENCSIRKTLKQKKREKRVLVREVKSLLEQQERQQTLLQQQQQQQQQCSSKGEGGKSSVGQEEEEDISSMIGSDEEKLINELEEHVVSSIRLHEEFLIAGSGENKKQQKPSIEKCPVSSGGIEVKGTPSSSSTAATTASTHSGYGNLSSREPSNSSANTTMIIQNKQSAPSHPHVALASLFDGNSSDSESETEEREDEQLPEGTTKQDGEKLTSVISAQDLPEHDVDSKSISSVAASFGGDSNGTCERSRTSTPLRPNPLLQLDQDDDDEQRRKDEEAQASHTFKPISLAQRGSATSRLVCPLADVVGTNEMSSAPSQTHQKDLQIYHLTFYTRKIGLQFQKVPAPPAKSRGLLTDALTADLAGETKGGSKTAAELKKVAAISTFANPANSDDSNTDAYLQVATPVDAVLVCGFEGFDDSGNNVRPKLGARLVAFDGVSVEVGRWTFDSIGKAIKARGRPLTLSFRNDFLTTDQRSIMTKAVGDMQRHQLKATTPAHLIQAPEDPPPQQHEVRPPSAVPSLQSAASHETDHWVNEATLQTANTVVHIKNNPGNQQCMDDIDDDLTVSTTGYSDHYSHHPHHLNRQYNGHYQQRRRLTASSTGSYRSHGSYGYSSSHVGRPTSYGNYRSFSEAGSSASALSSAVGPLLSNLMNGLSAEKKRASLTPDYLHRRQSVEEVPQHQDFKSNLL